MNHSARNPRVQAALLRLRRRRGSRGAVLVEGIIVSSMLILMMASALFFNDLYSQKLKTMRLSRAAAWEKALPGCNSAVELVALWQAVGVADAASGGALDGLNDDSNNAPRWLEVGRQMDAESATVQGGRFVGGTYQLSARNSVVCNEKGDDHRGDIIAVLKQMWEALIPSG